MVHQLCDGCRVDPLATSRSVPRYCGAGDLANSATAKVDFDFLDAVKTDVAQDQCVDQAHVFATGFSMGGYFTHHIGCDRTDIRAIGPASGGTIASLSGCAIGHKPVIIFHGTSDPLISSGCDDPNGTAQSGFPPSATLWAQKNGCQTTYQTIAENGTGGSGGQCYLTTAARVTDRSSSAHSPTWSPAQRAVRAALARATAMQAPRSWSGHSSRSTRGDRRPRGLWAAVTYFIDHLAAASWPGCSEARHKCGCLTSGDNHCSSCDNRWPSWGNSSESSWQGVDTRGFIAGEFIWTGFDSCPLPVSKISPRTGSIRDDRAGLAGSPACSRAVGFSNPSDESRATSPT